MSAWYYSSNKQQRGPVSIDDLKGLIVEGRVLAADLVWQEGMPQWVPLSSVAELASPLPSVAHPEIPGGINFSLDDPLPSAAVDVRKNQKKEQTRPPGNDPVAPPRRTPQKDAAESPSQRRRQQTSGTATLVLAGIVVVVVAGAFVVGVVHLGGGTGKEAASQPPDQNQRPAGSESLQLETSEIELLPGHEVAVAVSAGRAIGADVSGGGLRAWVDNDAVMVAAPADTEPLDRTITVIGPGGGRFLLKAKVSDSYLRTFNLKIATSTSWNVFFAKGRKVQIWVDSMAPSDVNLFVYDAMGRQVASDTSDGKDCYVSFVPDRSQMFRVEVANELLGAQEARWRNGPNNGSVRMTESAIDAEGPPANVVKKKVPAKSFEGEFFAFLRRGLKVRNVVSLPLDNQTETFKRYEDIAAEGVLIGLDLALGKDKRIDGLRPIYRTELGETYGAWRGKATSKTEKTLMAPDGYVVGSIDLDSGPRVNGLALNFVRLGQNGLDLNDRKNSAWVGVEGATRRIGVEGTFFVGVYGHLDSHGRVCSLGLLALGE